MRFARIVSLELAVELLTPWPRFEKSTSAAAKTKRNGNPSEVNVALVTQRVRAVDKDSLASDSAIP